MKKAIIVVIVILLILLVLFSVYYFVLKKENVIEPIFSKPTTKVDDWEYDSSKINYSRRPNQTTGISSALSVTESAEAFTGSSKNLGFSTGGAKDVNSFRENIKNGYFPISTDITYNGLFYDYYFETKKSDEKSDKMFYPSYSLATSKDPISNETEYFMTVGLNSNIKESDFQRKKLNLVVVLDISGSMSSKFNSYYYDFNSNETEKDSDTRSKMKIANESVNTLIDQLNPDDRLGIVLFDDDAYLAKKMNLILETDVDAIKEHVLEIEARGGTNFEAGYKEANKLFKNLKKYDANEYENRIIVITDAMPNAGTTDKDGILSMVKENSENGIYTTFIGVGVDFNTEVVERISDSKGANYYSVHSSSEFKKRMGEEFEFMVTPLVFDLDLNVESKDFAVEKVYGTDTKDNLKGNIIHVNTLFPSKSDDNGEVKGGVILVKLKKLNNNDNGTVRVDVSYKDRTEKNFSEKKDVEINTSSTAEMYEDTGIRKAIVLTRYANTLKNWILYERSEDKKFVILPTIGIMDCDYTENEVGIMLGENERPSQKLKVSEEYKNTFKQIKEYIQKENKELKDETLQQEIDILDELISL